MEDNIRSSVSYNKIKYIYLGPRGVLYIIKIIDIFWQKIWVQIQFKGFSR